MTCLLLLQSIAALATILGFPIVLCQFRSYRRETRQRLIDAQRQVISFVDSQLKVIGNWAKGPKEKGWKKEWFKPVHYLTWSNPLYVVFELGTPLQLITLTEASKHFGQEFFDAVSGLNQSITAFNNYVNKINLFSLADWHLAVRVHDKLKPLREKEYETLGGLSKDLKRKLSEEELTFVLSLQLLYFTLHTQLIGHEGSAKKGLYKWYIEAKRELKKAKRRLSE